MSVKVARKPFRSNGVVYRSGDIIESPDGIQLYATKLKHRIIIEVDEHNLDEVALYLERRRGVVNAKAKLQSRLGGADAKYEDPKYIEKVLKLAKKHELDTEGKSIKQLVDELKTLKK